MAWETLVDVDTGEEISVSGENNRLFVDLSWDDERKSGVFRAVVIDGSTRKVRYAKPIPMSPEMAEAFKNAQFADGVQGMSMDPAETHRILRSEFDRPRAETDAFRRQIGEQVKTIWGESLGYFDCMLSLLWQVAQKEKERISPDDELGQFRATQFLNAFATGMTVLELLTGGHANGAFMATRRLYETRTTLLYVLKQDDAAQYAERVKDHEAVDLMRLLRNDRDMGQVRFSPKYVDDIETRYSQVCRKYAKQKPKFTSTYGWAKAGSFADIERFVNRHQKGRDPNYRDASIQIHSARVARLPSTKAHGGLEPSIFGIERPLSWAASCIEDMVVEGLTPFLTDMRETIENYGIVTTLSRLLREGVAETALRVYALHSVRSLS